MRLSTGTLVKAVAWVGIALIVIVVFHLGGSFATSVGQFAPVVGAYIGGGLTLASVLYPRRPGENTEPWIGLEQLSWLLIGLGIIFWAIGDSFWRYYVSIDQAPFPSIADIGYFTLPLLAFIGLMLQPTSTASGKRTFLLLDSMISMGSIFAIAWYLLLGSLAQAPGEANLAKFLGIYYPTADTALLSCVVFLLLRGQGRIYQATARRTGLLIIGLGLCFFVASDFIFNIEQNAGTYVEATWTDLGWALGLLTIGVAAFLRRFLPSTSEETILERMELQAERTNFTPMQFVPYGLLALLFTALTLDVLAEDNGQRLIRPVLLLATLGVVALVVTRQIFTLWENMRLAQRQAESLAELEKANLMVAQQSHLIAEHNAELERGIEHLKDVQAALANGNLRARATLSKGALLPLAGSLNLMAERLTRLGQSSVYAQRIMRALSDLCLAFERQATGLPFVVPESCRDLTEINRLMVVLRVKTTGSQPSNNPPSLAPFPPISQSGTFPNFPPAPHPVTQPISPRHTTGSPPNPAPRKYLGLRPPSNMHPTDQNPDKRTN